MLQDLTPLFIGELTRDRHHIVHKGNISLHDTSYIT